MRMAYLLSISRAQYLVFVMPNHGVWDTPCTTIIAWGNMTLAHVVGTLIAISSEASSKAPQFAFSHSFRRE